MALPVLARAIGGSLIKGAAKGGKKKITSAMIASGGGSNGDGGGRGGALVAKPSTSLVPKGITPSAIVKAPEAKVTSARLSMEGILLVIRKDVSFIESFLNFDLTNKQTKLAGLKQDQSKKRMQKEEKVSKSGLKNKKFGLKLPKSGLVDGVKNFIGNMLMGMFVLKMMDFLKGKNITGILKTAGAAVDFIIGVGGTLLNGLATFIDWGYKAYDATLGFIEKFGGQGAVDNFEKFAGLIDTALFLTTTLAGSMALEAMTGGGGDGPGVLDFMKGKGATSAATKGTAAAAKGAGIGAGAAAAVVAGAGLLASALGEGAFQLRKLAEEPIKKTQKEFDKYNFLDPRKYLVGALLAGQKMLLAPIAAVGVLLDIVGAPFRYAIELIRYPFLSEEDKKKQATNLAKFDARIREDFRKGLNALTLGFAFKEKGSFGNIYGDKDAQKDMMSKMRGGGKARASGSPKQSIKKRRGLRKLPQKPTYTREPLPKSGESLGTSSIQSDKAWWDPAGVFTGKKTEKEIRASADVSRRIITVQNEVGEDQYFGPILTITSKLIRGQKPDFKDYQNVGLGINLLYQDGVKEGVIGDMPTRKYSSGGSVKSGISAGDISKWVQTTFEDKLRSKIQDALTLNVPETVGSGGGSGPGATPPPSVPNTAVPQMPVGGSADFWALAAIISVESGNAQGRADVAQSILNRAASGGVYGGGPSILGLINSPKQYEPVRRGDPGLWAKIKDSDTAIAALNSVPYVGGQGAQRLQEAAAVLNDDTLMENASQFVGPRTDFSTPEAMSVHKYRATHKSKEVTRHGHVFGFFVGPGAVDLGTRQFQSNASAAAFTIPAATPAPPAPPSSPGPAEVGDLSKAKKGGIYLHWSAGGGMTPHPDRYHRTILADGSVVGTHPLTQFQTPGGHTHGRNDKGVGLAIAAMAGWNWSTIKPIQLEKLAETAATIAKSMGYSAADINVRNVATHAEVGSMKDGVKNPPSSQNKRTPPPAPDNYGPYTWGGDGNKSDFFDINKQDFDAGKGVGGDKLRAMILAKFNAMKQGGFIGKYDKSMKSIEGFAPYESGAEQFVMVPLPSQGQSMPMMDATPPNTSLPVTVFADDQFEFLDYQG